MGRSESTLDFDVTNKLSSDEDDGLHTYESSSNAAYETITMALPTIDHLK